MGELEPLGGQPMWDLHLLAAALRTDFADVASYARVLTGALGDALPEGMVDVEYRRGLFSRGGEPVGLVVYGRERQLALHADRHGVRAETRHVVHDVVISRRQVDLDEWLTALAGELRDLATRNAKARTALDRLLES